MIKKFTLLFLGVFWTFVHLSAQGKDSTKTSQAGEGSKDVSPIEKIKVGIPKIQFAHYSHDFGHIAQGKPVYFEFEFLNNGTGTIFIKDAKSSCGCTAPEWNNEQVLKGNSGKIKANFNAATVGKFNKNITVIFSDGSSEVLVIKGYVDPPPYTPPPATITPGSPLVVPEN